MRFVRTPSRFARLRHHRSNPNDFLAPLERRELLAAVVALASDNVLLRFDSATPSVIQSGLIVTGLSPGEALIGADFRPADGKLYALAGNTGGTDRLFTIDLNTGAPTLVGSVTGLNLLASDNVAFDFNPVADRIRVIDAANNNWRVNPTTAALVATDTAISGGSRFPEVAYSNNFAGAATTVLYGIDDLNNRLVIFTLPNSGTFTPVGNLGIDPVAKAGFDIDANGTAFASVRLATGFNQFGLINLTTGAFSAIGTIAGSPTLGIISIAAIPAAHAPAITGGLTPVLNAIAEDSSGGSGTTISELIANAGGDLITDANAGALEGIAITSVDTSQGSWEYSLNGTNWSSLSNVFAFYSLLLPADGVARVRFNPAANVNGTLDSILTFRAWDRTSGTSGGRADTTTNGGTTAFSATAAQASITITPVYDAPSFGGEFTKMGPVPDSTTFAPYTGLGISYPDNASQSLNVTLTVNPSSAGVLTPASLTVSGFAAQATPGVYTFTGTAAAATTALRALQFDPANNLAPVGNITSAQIDMTIHDGIGPDVTPGAVQFGIGSGNDAPTIAGLTPANNIPRGTNARPFRRVRFTDPDPSDTLTVLITLDKPAKGSFTTQSLTASGFTRTARGKFQFTGTAATATTAIRLLRYQFSSNLATNVLQRVKFAIVATDASSATATNNATTATLA